MLLTADCSVFPYIAHAKVTSYYNALGGTTVLMCDLGYKFNDGSLVQHVPCTDKGWNFMGTSTCECITF